MILFLTGECKRENEKKLKKFIYAINWGDYEYLLDVINPVFLDEAITRPSRMRTGQARPSQIASLAHGILM